MGKKFFLFFFLVIIKTAGAADAEYSANQTAYDAMGAAEAYALGFTGQGVTVAVVDNGTRLTHQELQGQVSGLQKDEYNVQDISDHGTPVSSLIAGAKDGQGMHGVAYGAKLVAFATELDDGVDCPTCYSGVQAWNVLAGDAFDSVKIINNSYAAKVQIPSYELVGSEINAAMALVAKDKLIVASAGNQTALSPAGWPAGLPYYEASLKNNFISAIAYDPSYAVSSPMLLAGYTNLAENAQEWSLAAPVGSLTAASEQNDSSYGPFAGTSAAAPIISGAAAVVSSAFPYMGGKQLADVLFSTANKNYATFSKYMFQRKNDGTVRFLFFGSADGYGKDWTEAEKTAAVQAQLGATSNCSTDKVFCNDVVYTDVFGQGVLNLENAVKGPGYLDANRLGVSDFDGTQYYYTVNTKNYNSVWSNDIGQAKSTSGNIDANVGLKKQGGGTLTLAGQNMFLGTSVVQGGELSLVGSLPGNVVVDGGVFSMLALSKLNGKLTVNPSGLFRAEGGTLNNELENRGRVLATGGKSVGNILNTGTFTVSGFQSGNVLTAGNFTAAGTFLNKNLFEFVEKGGFTGTLDNQAKVIVRGEGTLTGILNNTVSGSVNVFENVKFNVKNGALENTGILYGSGEIAGIVNNRNTGSVATSLAIQQLNSSGNIMVVSGTGGAMNTVMYVDTLNITGGRFTWMPGQRFDYENGQRYTLIDFNTLSSFTNFENKSMFSDFVSATAHLESDRIDMTIDFLRMAATPATASFDQNEKTVVRIMDSMFFENAKNDFKGYYFLNSNDLKKQINKMSDQIRPVNFASLPLSNGLLRGVQAHLFERQNSKDPYLYEGPKQYYTPSKGPKPPRGDLYRAYRPENAEQIENKRYQAPRTNDVYRNYRPGNQERIENYRHSVPRKKDVYRNFRPSGRSGGQSYGVQHQAWGQVLYGTGSWESGEKAGREDAESKGIGAMFGWDFVYSNDFLWGITAGYAQSSVSQEEDSTDITDMRFGAYFSRQQGFFSIDGALMAGLQDFDKKRMTVLPTKTFESTSSFGGSSLEAALNVGYDLQQVPLNRGDLTFRPYLGLTLVQMTQDAYREKGDSDLNLSVEEAKDTSVIVSPGIIAGFVAGEGSFFLFEPEYLFVDLRYEQTLSGGNPMTKAYFSADSLQTTFESLENEEKSAVSIGIGVNGRLSSKTQLHLLFNNRSGSKSSAQTISATIIHAF